MSTQDIAHELSDIIGDICQAGRSMLGSSEDVTAGYHVGVKANDPDAALRKSFTDRDCQVDGLASILRYCQIRSGYRPGDSDASGMMEIIETEFSKVVTIKVQPTTFMKWFNQINYIPSISGLVSHLPNNARLLQWLNSSIPNSGYYNRSMLQMFTELEGDYLSFYTITITRSSSRGDSLSFTYNSVDRDEMANSADWLVDKLNVKEDIDHWANGISSDGYKY